MDQKLCGGNRELSHRRCERDAPISRHAPERLGLLVSQRHQNPDPPGPCAPNLGECGLELAGDPSSIHGLSMTLSGTLCQGIGGALPGPRTPKAPPGQLGQAGL